MTIAPSLINILCKTTCATVLIVHVLWPQPALSEDGDIESLPILYPSLYSGQSNRHNLGISEAELTAIESLVISAEPPLSKSVTEAQEAPLPLTAEATGNLLRSASEKSRSLRQAEAPQAPNPTIATDVTESLSAPADVGQSQDFLALMGGDQPKTDSQSPENQNFLGQESAAEFPELYKRVFYALGALAALSIVIVSVAKRAKRRGLNTQREGRTLDLVATLPIAPKRQIFLIKVRDAEIAIASTEHGISFLSEVNMPTLNTTFIDEKNMRTLPEAPKPMLGIAAQISAPATSSIDSGRAAKSEILRKALETIESKRQTQIEMKEKSHFDASPSQETAEARPKKNLEKMTKKTLSTLETKRPPLRKMFSNSYLQNSVGATGPKTENENNNFDQNAKTEHVENVAQLIRDKLKQMKSIS